MMGWGTKMFGDWRAGLDAGTTPGLGVKGTAHSHSDSGQPWNYKALE